MNDMELFEHYIGCALTGLSASDMDIRKIPDTAIHLAANLMATVRGVEVEIKEANDAAQ